MTEDQFFKYMFPFIFIFFWLSISAFISFISGWHKLAKLHPWQEPVRATKLGPIAISFGYDSLPASIGGVYVRLSPYAISFSIIFLFRFFNPPMSVPWSQVSSCTQSKWLFWPITVLRFREISQSMRFSGRAARKIFEYWRNEAIRKHA
jgi:hypothetical protein